MHRFAILTCVATELIPISDILYRFVKELLDDLDIWAVVLNLRLIEFLFRYDLHGIWLAAKLSGHPDNHVLVAFVVWQEQVEPGKPEADQGPDFSKAPGK